MEAYRAFSHLFMFYTVLVLCGCFFAGGGGRGVEGGLPLERTRLGSFFLPYLF